MLWAECFPEENGMRLGDIDKGLFGYGRDQFKYPGNSGGVCCAQLMFESAPNGLFVIYISPQGYFVLSHLSSLTLCKVKYSKLCCCQFLDKVTLVCLALLNIHKHYSIFNAVVNLIISIIKTHLKLTQVGREQQTYVESQDGAPFNSYLYEKTTIKWGVRLTEAQLLQGVQ
jgi:hypothetical protein